jgi:hypothetical protein
MEARIYGLQFAITQVKGTQHLGSNGDEIANFSVWPGFLTDDLDRPQNLKTSTKLVTEKTSFYQRK